jgi:hypothetical protein
MLEADTTEETNLWAHTVYTTEGFVYVVAVPGKFTARAESKG